MQHSNADVVIRTTFYLAQALRDHDDMAMLLLRFAEQMENLDEDSQLTLEAIVELAPELKGLAR